MRSGSWDFLSLHGRGARRAGLCRPTLPAFYVLFEIMAFTSVVLVLHEQTGEALFAGAEISCSTPSRGAFMALFGVMFFAYQLGDLTFKAGGILGGLADGDMRNTVLLVSAVMIVGFGTKAGMFPMHGWLSTAHPAAPAPGQRGALRNHHEVRRPGADPGGVLCHRSGDVSRDLGADALDEPVPGDGVHGFHDGL